MSPTVERLAVYIWLNLIDKRLPAHIARIYAHDLQSSSLKDMQPRIADAMDSLLAEINTQEDIQVQYTKSFYKGRKQSLRRGNHKSFNNLSSNRKLANPTNKICIICKAAGRPYQGHNVSTCWHISKFERLEIAKALVIEVDDVDDENEEGDVLYVHCDASISKGLGTQNILQSNEGSNLLSVNRVECDVSPHFYAFVRHLPCHVVVDTGATSSVVSKSFLKRVGIPITSTLHTARQADKSPLDVKGEVHLTLNYGDSDLQISALVVDSLSSDILAGIPFCKKHDVNIYSKQEEISILVCIIPYGRNQNQGNGSRHIRQVESHLLRSNVATVILPDDFIEIHDKSLKDLDEEVSIEPRINSPLNGKWPTPFITRVIEGKIRIPNHSKQPIQVTRHQHVAQVRPTIDISSVQASQKENQMKAVLRQTREMPLEQFYSDAISVDPDNQLSRKDRQDFIEINKSQDNVFNSRFGTYNDHSGTIRAHVDIGPVLPPPTKGRLPFYNQANLNLLQEEADKLEDFGVLVKPEDVGVQVKYVSPSFLVKKPSGGHRFVTAFNGLSQYTRAVPTISTSCSDVLRKISSWKFLIQTDLTQSFYQIRVSKSSLPYLGTVTPFKGLRVYSRSAMGMPGSTEHLQELMSRVFGNYIQRGFLTIIADDMYIGGNSIEELKQNWLQVLMKLRENNLYLSPSKTLICPTRSTILGWIWQSGTLTASQHKIAPLVALDLPKTCSAMRSFIGSYKALSRCIPNYSIVAPLEDAIKGMKGSQNINWTTQLETYFKEAQQSLKTAQTLTIPTPEDKLVMTVDASPKNKGLGATLYIVRNGKRAVVEFHTFKLKSHQIGWIPCEHEALAICEGINYFSVYIRESNYPLQILTDSMPCVQAYKRLCKGQFSASPRVSTFLSALSRHKVNMCHLPGSSNQVSDFSSRNPIACSEQSCQICKFVDETLDSVVRSVSVNDILSGTSGIPFSNISAWRSVQQDCPVMRRAYAHLTQGTRPSKKAKNLKDLRRYLNSANVDSNGVLVIHKPDPFLHQRKLIMVPSHIVSGVITALHIYLQHPTMHQLKKVFNRFFHAINSNSEIEKVTKLCDQCNSLKTIPKEMIKQSSSPSPITPGSEFASDVIRRNKQKILLTVDIHSSFMSAKLLSDESSTSLRDALLLTTCLLRCDKCVVRVDGATGFQALSNDSSLKQYGIELDFGRLKNPNKNPVAEKGIKDLEEELLCNDAWAPVSDVTLQLVIDKLNGRIRNRGLSAKEIILLRDQHTREQIALNNVDLAKSQEESRVRNHPLSEASKGQGASLAKRGRVHIGDLIYI